jgi:transglutaminase-like putative cysteine protease
LRLKVTHSSLYRYQPAVETAQHFLHLKPRDMPCQRLESHHLSITPEPTELFESQDFYQNPTHYLALLTQHHRLSITSESVLNTWAFGHAPVFGNQLHLTWGTPENEDIADASTSQAPSWSGQPWGHSGIGSMQSMQQMLFAPFEDQPHPNASPLSTAPSSAMPRAYEHWSRTSAQSARDHYEYHAGKQFDEASDFLFDSPHVPRLEIFTQYARRTLGSHPSLVEGLTELMGRIHQEFEYQSKSTQVNTPLLDIFHSRKGVCQDFAHLMVACCRSYGLAARYVSGYILTHPPPGQARLIGSDASHAWSSVYLPSVPGDQKSEGVWFDLDPTNNRCGLYSPGEDYITTAWGRDYSDVSPVRGVIQGGNDHLLDVAVTVEPLDP